MVGDTLHSTSFTMPTLLSLFTFATAATASWSGNINYGSPSLRHNLGISMPKLMKRQAGASYMDPSSINFTHGIASGDPYPTSVILWTRASPMMDDDRSNVTVSGTVPLYNHDTEEYVRVSKNPVCVSYQVATDRNLSHVVTRGQAYTSSDIDYTVKVEATGLKPFTQYYYQFSVCGSSNKSPVGRTKTSPRTRDALSSVAVAVYSCSNFPNGFFNAYGNVARKDSVDYVIHVGPLPFIVLPFLTVCSSVTTSTSTPRPVQHDRYSRRRRSSLCMITDGALPLTGLIWICYSLTRCLLGFRSGTTTKSATTATAMALPASTILRTPLRRMVVSVLTNAR